MADYNYKIKSWPAMPRSEKRKAQHAGSGSMSSSGVGGSGADASDKADKIHDHAKQLIRPQVLIIPQQSPTDADMIIGEGEIAEWLDPEGNYTEPAPQGVAAVYELTLKNGNVTLGVFQPGVEPISIDLSQLIQGLAAQSWVTAQLASYVNNGSYNSQTKKIELSNGNRVLAQIDATAFIKDGMIDSVAVQNGYLVITFNTDAGKDPIRIPISDLFDANAYLPLAAGSGKALTGTLYARGIIPNTDKAYNIGSTTERYNAVFAGRLDGGNGDLGLWRTLNNVAKAAIFLSANKLQLGVGYAEAGLPTEFYGSVINFFISTSKTRVWTIDANGHLVPAGTRNIGAAANRVETLYAKEVDAQTLNVSGISTQTDVEISGSVALPIAPPSNPVAGKYYEWINLNGNPYTE